MIRSFALLAVLSALFLLACAEAEEPVAGPPPGENLAGGTTVDWDMATRAFDRDGDTDFDATDLAEIIRSEDRNEDGRLSRAELAGFFRRLLRNAELRAEGPLPGVRAPDVSLYSARDGRETTLLSLTGHKPTLLLLGSTTCVHTQEDLKAIKSGLPGLEKLNLVFVYIREAHPGRGSARFGPLEVKEDPATLEARRDLARKLAELGSDGLAVFADGMDDMAAQTYGAWPARLYLIGTDGKILFRGGRIPSGTMLVELERQLPRLID